MGLAIRCYDRFTSSGVNQCGSYFNAGADVTTFKAALETEAAAAGFAMTYSYGANPDNASTAAIPAAVEAAKAADVVVAVVGDTTNTCGEMVDRSGIDLPGGYVTFRLDFHHFDRFELDLRGHIHVRGAALSCLRLKLADIVLI